MYIQVQRIFYFLKCIGVISLCYSCGTLASRLDSTDEKLPAEHKSPTTISKIFYVTQRSILNKAIKSGSDEQGAIAHVTKEPQKIENANSTVNLAFLPALALLFFFIAVFLRACKWYRESAKLKERGCSYDVASYVILVQGDRDFSDVDMRTDCTSNLDTVTSFTSFVRSNGVYDTITSCRSLQQRIDSKYYETVASYQAFLQKMKKDKAEVGHMEMQEIGTRPRLNSQNSMKGRPRATLKITKDSRFSVVPAIDNYIRLKNSFNRSPTLQINAPNFIKKSDTDPPCSPRILKRSYSNSPPRPNFHRQDLRRSNSHSKCMRKPSKRTRKESDQLLVRSSVRNTDIERDTKLKGRKLMNDETVHKVLKQGPVMINAETQIDYPIKRRRTLRRDETVEISNEESHTIQKTDGKELGNKYARSETVKRDDEYVNTLKSNGAFSNDAIINGACNMKIDNVKTSNIPETGPYFMSKTEGNDRRNVISVLALIHKHSDDADSHDLILEDNEKLVTDFTGDNNGEMKPQMCDQVNDLLHNSNFICKHDGCFNAKNKSLCPLSDPLCIETSKCNRIEKINECSEHSSEESENVQNIDQAYLNLTAYSLKDVCNGICEISSEDEGDSNTTVTDSGFAENCLESIPVLKCHYTKHCKENRETASIDSAGNESPINVYSPLLFDTTPVYGCDKSHTGCSAIPDSDTFSPSSSASSLSSDEIDNFTVENNGFCSLLTEI